MSEEEGRQDFLVYYIVIDLEWNQTYHEKAVATQKELSIRLRGEVIQIGAVKLDEALRICGSYRITVKPRFYKKIHRHVMRLTGIDQAQLDHGVPLAEAMESFHRFCTDDAVFLTWGPDDMPMLFDNLRANKLSYTFLDRYYDMQPMFNRETDGEKRQRSLEYAMEHFGIDMNLPAHDALNDALFTARVAQKLNIAEGIRVADAKTGDHLFEAVLGDADSGERGFPTPERAVAVSEVTAPVCPTCKKPLLQKEPLLHAKGQKYQALFACEEHGEMMMCAAVKRNINETFRVRVILMRPDEERLTRYREKLANEKEFRRARRRPRSRRSGKKTATPATTE
ncbi:MAG: exonuclease domain-containing protein [Clostridia bacterium]|nr:exonuclease domain-containing protein [Clostridia bacterium]